MSLAEELFNEARNEGIWLGSMPEEAQSSIDEIAGMYAQLDDIKAINVRKLYDRLDELFDMPIEMETFRRWLKKERRQRTSSRVR